MKPVTSQQAPADLALGAALGATEVTKDYVLSGKDRMPAIGGVSLDLGAGEFVSVVGPSGCGKTTLLRCLSGLLKPDSGTVTYDGQPVTGVPQSMSIVFQEYGRSLLPWLTSVRNVSFGLRDLGRAEAADRARTALEMVGIGEFADRHPWQLSGGMQQRVAIARAIARRPRCLLMDEPFASVDALTRESLEELTLNLAGTLNFSTLLVTHDIDEAIFMADRVVVLSRRPSRVRASITIDLPRPRDEVDTRANPLFQEYRREIHSMIMEK
jgi:NitT/TauT family transport system ATP-binding protein